MYLLVLENSSTPSFSWLEICENEDACDFFLRKIESQYPAATQYKITRILKIENDKSIDWVRLRLRMAFFRYQSHRDPRELKIEPNRLAKILQLVLPVYPGKKGNIYILVNEFYDNLIKIGITRRSIKQRIKELRSTGVPADFICVYSAIVDNPEEIENRLLSLFERPSNNREFIKTGVDITWLVQFHQIRQSTPKNLYTTKQKGGEFNNFIFQGFLEWNNMFINTHYNSVSKVYEAETLKKLSLDLDTKMNVNITKPVILLSLSGLRYIGFKKWEKRKKRFKKIAGKNENEFKYYSQDEKITAINQIPIPFKMGEYIRGPSLAQNDIYKPFEPLKQNKLAMVLECLELGDIPFHSHVLLQSVMKIENSIFVSENSLIDLYNTKSVSVEDEKWIYDLCQSRMIDTDLIPPSV